MNEAPRVAFDIGGTFTDVVVAGRGGALRTFKLLSIPERVAGDIRERLLSTLGRAGPVRLESLVHGTTIGSNALLEGSGARTGLLATEGFRDELELRRLARPGIYDYGWQRTPPLVPRRRRREVAGRIAADGAVLRPLDREAARAALETLREQEIEALAICLINAYANPEHEVALEALARELLPGVAVCRSSDVLPEIREYERASTTAVNAYLMPVAGRYLDTLERELGDLHPHLRVMQSNGGVMTTDHARRRPVYLVESGPAAGVVGAAVLIREAGLGPAVSFDMGGTTVKTCLIEGRDPVERAGMEVGGAAHAASRHQRGAGYHISVPALDIVEAGAGGGSLAWVDAGGALRVGPSSAGARPGPACYPNGGARPTLTDANVLLGYMNPTAIAGGGVTIDRARARAVFERELCPTLGLSVREAAHGVHAVANAAMMRAIRAVTTERGRDPRSLTLVAFGGAGPIHAAGLAEMLGMRRVVVPLHPGLFSALGLLLADLRYDSVHSAPGPLEEADVDGLETAFRALETELRDEVAKEGLDPDALHLERALDLRYRGQASELTLSLARDARLDPAVIAEAFHAEHARSFGYRSDAEPVVLVTMRLKAVAPTARLRFADLADGLRGDRSGSATGASRDAYFGPAYGTLDTALCTRPALAAAPASGPLIVEEFDTTIVVPPGWRAAVDARASLVLEREAAS